MKVWVTKYALTIGIMELDAEATSQSGRLAVRRSRNSYPQYYYGEGKEWHRSKDAAIARANTMRAAKIKSVKKQLERLEALEFK